MIDRINKNWQSNVFMRADIAAKRALVQKTDEERIGTRYTVEREGKKCGVVVVSVNYTKLDTKPVDYSVKEITDTMKFFASKANGFESAGKSYRQLLNWNVTLFCLLNSTP